MIDQPDHSPYGTMAVEEQLPPEGIVTLARHFVVAGLGGGAIAPGGGSGRGGDGVGGGLGGKGGAFIFLMSCTQITCKREKSEIMIIFLLKQIIHSKKSKMLKCLSWYKWPSIHSFAPFRGANCHKPLPG